MRSMRFKQHQQRSKPPEVNLVPMIDVLMVVLTFFIIISMVLTAEKGVNVALTGGKNQPPPNPQEKLPDPMIVELIPPDQIIVNRRVLNKEQLDPEVRAYLENNPKGAVLLKADRSMQYQKVIDLLGKMQAIGGSKVSLALESGSDDTAVRPFNATPGTADSAAPEQPAADPEQSAAAKPEPAVEIPEVPEDYDS